MWKAFGSLDLRSPEFVNIFLVAAAILAVQTAARFVTKLPIICNQPPDQAAKRAARFDCLRLGLDLSFMGFVAALAIIGLTVEQGHADKMTPYGTLFVVIQVFLIFLTAIFSAVFDSPETDYHLGIWVPSLIGLVSIYFSAAVMTALSR